MTGRKKTRVRAPAGGPFLEIDGRLYLDLSYDIAPFDPDLRDSLGSTLGRRPRDLLVLRRLTVSEERRVRRRREDADVEAWAVITAGSSRTGDVDGD